MPNSSDVDTAVINLLASDATIQSLLPDGVFYDSAPFGSTRFAIVAQIEHNDTYVLHGVYWERFLYLVKGVAQDAGDGSAGATLKQAAQRMYELLQDAHVTQRLAPLGYRTVLVQRAHYLRDTVPDQEVDQRWLHRGGWYDVLVAPTA